MQYEPMHRSVIRKADPRFAIDIAAQLVLDDAAPTPTRLVNLSRNGFRLLSDLMLPADTQIRLEVDGWPRQVARVIWCDRGRLGCLFDPPPGDALFTMMQAACSGRDRDEF